MRRWRRGRERNEKRNRCSYQEAQKYKEGGQPKWLDYIGRSIPGLGWRVQGRGQGMSARRTL